MRPAVAEREFFIDNLVVRIHFIIVMIRWTGLAPWEFDFLFPGSAEVADEQRGVRPAGAPPPPPLLLCLLGLHGTLNPKP